SWLWPLAAVAAPDPCQLLPDDAARSPEAGQRIAAAACAEHRAWYRPFIDTDGRIGPVPVREAVRTQLADGQPAWERVVEYWRGRAAPAPARMPSRRRPRAGPSCSTPPGRRHSCHG